MTMLSVQEFRYNRYNPVKKKKKLLLSCQDLQAALLDADALPNYHIVISDIRLSIDRLPSQGKMSGG